MKLYWTKKAEQDLNGIYLYIVKHFSKEVAFYFYQKIKLAVQHLELNPEMGRKIGNHFHKRYLVIDGNVINYEIVLKLTPMVIIRRIKPRKMVSPK